MIVSQLGLLYLCLRFRATPPARQISAQPHSSGPGLIPQSPDEQRASREDLESSSSNQAKFNLVVSPPTPLDYREESNDVRRDSLNGSGDRLSLSPPSTARPQSAHSSSASRYKKPLLASLGLENLQIPVLGRTSRYGMIDEEEDGPASAQEPSTGPRSVYTRPFGLWQWQNFLSYLAFLVGYVTVLGLFNLILGRSSVYVAALGFLALGLESTLPIPQLLR
ncbi:hypothetical protein IE53DRAFT_124354 [Violaceomyces palustris]|uniref:Uncharacterized protein n=1 Tax=Violaceomyces palustris TaxID=1673888 RepID=A0ACD0NVP2_9BASI|nr:hypothetical protein IE53DRAFT_124354 [Violaceomyces palustris]